MRQVTALLWLVSACLAARASAKNVRTPTPYPTAFRMEFNTNITSEYESNYPLGGTLYYDWSQRSQRIDHTAGSYECVKFYETEEACSLYFVSRGMYRVIHGGASEGSTRNEDEVDIELDCCLDIPGLGTPPPDWGSKANPTFNGVVLDQYSGFETYQWTFDRLEPPNPTKMANKAYNIPEKKEEQHLRKLFSDSPLKDIGFHVAREVSTVSTVGGQGLVGAPILFSFPGEAKGRQDYHYDVGSLVVGPQNPDLFELPVKGCADVLCEETQLNRPRRGF